MPYCGYKMRKGRNSMSGIMLDTPEQIAFARMASLKGALKLEVRTGMKFSNRVNVYQTCKREYGLKGNKAEVLRQMEELVAQALGQ
jgi:hypothetical protein